jgi:mono/diheme cytochrome c family protein
MKRPRGRWRAAGVVAFSFALGVAGAAGGEGPVERGRYLAAAGGCASCHTADRDDAVAFAGGRALATAFGTFYAPNITPDRATGIGQFSDDDFLAALHEGRRPDGAAYFPAFPYPAYSGMSRDDVLAIKAYLFSLPPVSQPNRPHELPWYLGARLGASAWRWLHFEPGRFVADPTRDARWNRGAYLVRHLGHCGECHTPRTALGALRPQRELAGNPAGPENRAVPNITPHEPDGIGAWTDGELDSFFEFGMMPDGDFVGAGMGTVIDDNTSQLTAEDRAAIIAYLRALPALPAATGR